MGPLEPWPMAAVVVAMAALAIVAYRSAFLDRGGAGLAFGMGILILFGVGLGPLVLLFFFAAVSFLATRLGVRRKRRIVPARGVDERRGWLNVTGNGGTAAAVGALGFLFPVETLALPFAVAVAVAAADTVASEIGSLSSRVVLITRPTRRVSAGVDGGVSALGTAASLSAALSVAALAHVLVPISDPAVLLVAALGFAGSLLDSVIGALWERSAIHPRRRLTKTQVNLIAITVPTLASFLWVL